MFIFEIEFTNTHIWIAENWLYIGVFTTTSFAVIADAIPVAEQWNQLAVTYDPTNDIFGMRTNDETQWFNDYGDLGPHATSGDIYIGSRYHAADSDDRNLHGSVACIPLWVEYKNISVMDLGHPACPYVGFWWLF